MSGAEKTDVYACVVVLLEKTGCSKYIAKTLDAESCNSRQDSDRQNSCHNNIHYNRYWT